MAEGEVEPWSARGENGRYKSHMQSVRPGDLGLCYQTHRASKLVAELQAVSGLIKRRGKEAVRIELVRFLEPAVPWFTIDDMVTAARDSSRSIICARFRS